MNEPKKLTVRTHYFNDDPECCKDYAAVTVWLGAKKAAEYGDWYHDKGREKATGFVDAMTSIFKDIVVHHERIADWEC